MKTNYSLIFISIAVFLAACAQKTHQSETHHQPLQINELMLTTIASASNTIWAIQSFDDDINWVELNKAVTDMHNSSTRLLNGGLKKDGSAINISPEWLSWSQQMIDATNDLQQAINQRQENDYFDASDRLYTPCEECHKQYLGSSL